MSYLIGIDLGGSSIKALALSPKGERLFEQQRSFDVEAADDWATEIHALVSEIEDTQGEPALSIGLSAPGLVNRDMRSIRNMPGRLQGLEGLNWTLYLGRKSPVTVMNDAQAALAGEAWVGAVRNIDNVVFLTLGTGVGGAVKVDGRLLRGAIGRAGHVGHMCLDPSGEPDICRTPGSIELAVGNCTIRDRTNGKFETTHALVDAVRSGDEAAQGFWQETVHHLACGIASLVNVLDPEVVVIGGGISRAGNNLFEPLASVLDEIEWIVPGHRVEIRPALLGEWAGAYGAAIAGFQGVQPD